MTQKISGCKIVDEKKQCNFYRSRQYILYYNGFHYSLLQPPDATQRHANPVRLISFDPDQMPRNFWLFICYPLKRLGAQKLIWWQSTHFWFSSGLIEYENQWNEETYRETYRLCAFPPRKWTDKFAVIGPHLPGGTKIHAILDELSCREIFVHWW